MDGGEQWGVPLCWQTDSRAIGTETRRYSSVRIVVGALRTSGTAISSGKRLIPSFFRVLGSYEMYYSGKDEGSAGAGNIVEVTKAKL